MIEAGVTVTCHRNLKKRLRLEVEDLGCLIRKEKKREAMIARYSPPSSH